jgi:GTPase SAR1 family protein
MAKNFDLTPDDIVVNNQSNSNPKSPASSSYDSNITVEEALHPNQINVVIADPSPIIILFGAGSSGKTFTLIRLTRWLKQHGYKVEPDRNFRPSNSTHYKQMCDQFDEFVNSDSAVGSTQLLSFMLVKVMNKYGEPICQILEAPGEHYFKKESPNEQFPRYINTICTIDNPKTWMFIVERNWEDQQDRRKYAEKIIRMQSQIESKDRVIFTCHKADLHPALFSAGQPNSVQFFKDLQNQYPGIFSKYMNQNPITKLWRKYNFDFVIFSAGLFNEVKDNAGNVFGDASYTQSNDKYPAELWNAILKTVKGRW